MAVNIEWLVVFELLKSFKTKLKNSPSSNMKWKCVMKVTSLSLCYVVTLMHNITIKLLLINFVFI